MVPADYQSLYIDIASDIEGTKLLPCVTHYLGGKKAGLKDAVT